MASFSDDEKSIVKAFCWFTCSLSIAGSLFVMLCIVKFRKCGILHFRLVFMMSASAIPGNASYLGLHKQTGMCTPNAIMQLAAETCVYLWVMSIAWTLYKSVMYEQIEETEEQELIRENGEFKKYMVLINMFALVVCCLPFIGNTYGEAGLWCWISDSKAIGSVWRYVCWFAPVWICWILLLYMYGRIMYAMCYVEELEDFDKPPPDELDADEKAAMRGLVRRLIAYPLIMTFSHFFPAVNRVNDTIYPDEPSIALTGMSLVALNMNGLLNAFAYGLNASLLQDVRVYCSRGAINSESTSEVAAEGAEEGLSFDAPANMDNDSIVGGHSIGAKRNPADWTQQALTLNPLCGQSLPKQSTIAPRLWQHGGSVSGVEPQTIVQDNEETAEDAEKQVSPDSSATVKNDSIAVITL